jgi:hypothetical protein
MRRVVRAKPDPEREDLVLPLMAPARARAVCDRIVEHYIAARARAARGEPGTN